MPASNNLTSAKFMAMTFNLRLLYVPKIYRIILASSILLLRLLVSSKLFLASFKRAKVADCQPLQPGLRIFHMVKLRIAIKIYFIFSFCFMFLGCKWRPWRRCCSTFSQFWGYRSYSGFSQIVSLSSNWTVSAISHM